MLVRNWPVTRRGRPQGRQDHPFDRPEIHETAPIDELPCLFGRFQSMSWGKVKGLQPQRLQLFEISNGMFLLFIYVVTTLDVLSIVTTLVER